MLQVQFDFSSLLDSTFQTFTGCVDDELSKGDMDWEDYWRLLFKKITEEDIREFETKYKGSEEETSDIMQLYERYKVITTQRSLHGFGKKLGAFS